MKCTVKLSEYMYVVKYSIWVNMDECTCHHPTYNKVNKYWGQQWKQGKRCLIESGTPFLGFENPFFPDQAWNVKHAKSFWSEKKSVLCISITSEMGLKLQQLGQNMRHKTKNFRSCHPQICVPTSPLHSSSSSQSRYLDLMIPNVVWVQNQDREKKNLIIYLLDVCQPSY